MTTATHQYGLKPAKNARSLKLADILRPDLAPLPVVPTDDDNLAALTDWQMLGNGPGPDNAAAGVPPYGAGDCVAVTWANERRLLTAKAGAEVYPTLDEVLAFYKTQNPGFPTQDGGMDIQTALEYLHDNGGPDGAKPVAFAQVDHSNFAEVNAAIAIFGCVWTGVTVSRANEDAMGEASPVWDYDPASEQLGGHSIIVGGYDTSTAGPVGARAITWAQEVVLTPAFWQNQVNQAWVLIWPELLTSARFLDGIDIQALSDAYTAVTDQPWTQQ